MKIYRPVILESYLSSATSRPLSFFSKRQKVNESPRDLLLILSEIERELGENITDPDLIEALEHGGIVEGAKRTWEHVKERYWKIHKKVIPSEYLSNGTSGIVLI